jgi:hypothetical protein
LGPEDLGELLEYGRSQDLLREEERSGPALDLVVKIRRIDADDGGDAGLLENPDSQLAVAPARRENENPEVGAGGTVAGNIAQRPPLADSASAFPRN